MTGGEAMLPVRSEITFFVLNYITDSATKAFALCEASFKIISHCSELKVVTDPYLLHFLVLFCSSDT